MSDLAQLGLVRTRGFSSWLIRVVTKSHWNHVILMVDNSIVISAETTGVQLMPADHFPNAVWSQFIFKGTEQTDIIRYAMNQYGKPYGVLTYLWIGVARLTNWDTPTWLEKRISDQHHWICSQLVDAAYTHAGAHLFRDHRPPGAVTPADLAAIMRDFGWINQA